MSGLTEAFCSSELLVVTIGIEPILFSLMRGAHRPSMLRYHIRAYWIRTSKEILQTEVSAHQCSLTRCSNMVGA